tara:strand:+ start:6232 stop:7959 length:1728 start_codon:yes stop_codon:yes gene_type:complete
MADNPRPPEDTQLKGFAKLADQLREQNETAKTIDENRIFAEKIQSQLLDDSIKLTQDQREELRQLSEILSGNELASLEEKKEAKAIAEQTLEALEGILENTEDLGKISGPVEAAGIGLLAIPGALLGLAVGFVSGVAASLASFVSGVAKGLIKGTGVIVKGILQAWKLFYGAIFKTLNFFTGGLASQLANGISKSLNTLGTSLKSNFARLAGSVKDIFTGVTKGVKNAQKAFAAGFAGLNVFRKTTGQFGKLGFFGRLGGVIGTLAKPFKAIGSLVGRLKNFVLAPLQGLGSTFKSLGKFIPSPKIFGPAQGIFKRVSGILKTVFSAFRSIGSFLGRLFVPLTAIIFTIKNIFSGIKNGEGIFEIIGNTISDLFKFFITDFLDLIRNVFAWIAGKLGFENIAESLESFSFAEIFSNIFTTIKDTIIGFIDNIKDSIADIGMGDTIKNVSLSLLKILKKILLFPAAVAAGAVAGLAAAWPGGKTPGEAFTDKFNKVFTLGDDTIDSFKVQGDGLTERGEEVQVMSGQNELDKTTQGQIQAAANNIVSSTDNSKRQQTFVSQKPATPDRTSQGLASR